MSDHSGAFPDTEEGLLTLPGVGPYTAAAIASIAFGRSAPVMDGNIERVMSRLFCVEDPLPASKPVLKEHVIRLTPTDRPGDHAQALMDLGATICTPKSPACGICPLMSHCTARTAGIAGDLPRKTPKKPKPTRLGYVYLARRADGAIAVAQPLLEEAGHSRVLDRRQGHVGAASGSDAAVVGEFHQHADRRGVREAAHHDQDAVGDHIGLPSSQAGREVGDDRRAVDGPQ